MMYIASSRVIQYSITIRATYSFPVSLYSINTVSLQHICLPRVVGKVSGYFPFHEVGVWCFHFTLVAVDYCHPLKCLSRS